MLDGSTLVDHRCAAALPIGLGSVWSALPNGVWLLLTICASVSPPAYTERAETR